MGFSEYVSRTDAAALIPEEVHAEILQEVADTNPVLQLARRLPNMSRKQLRMPVASALATAYFVDGDTGLEQTADLDWTNKYVDAEGLAAIVPIPKSVLEDAEYDVFAQVRPNIVEAINIAIVQAVFYGTNIPASWTTNLGAAGLVALATARSTVVSIASFTDLYEAIMGESAAGSADGLLMKLEAQGFICDGHIAHPLMRGRLRNCRTSTGEPLLNTASSSTNDGANGSNVADIDGQRIFFPRDGSVVSGSSLDIAGEWRNLVWAMRRDLAFEVSTQSVITDGAGNVVFNLFQQDMVALKVTTRIGFALPNPIKRMAQTAATRCPFAVLTA